MKQYFITKNRFAKPRALRSLRPDTRSARVSFLLSCRKNALRGASCVFAILLLAVFATFLLPRLFSSSPASAEYEFMQEGKSIEWTMLTYHTFINDTFNQNFRMLSENLSKNERVDQNLINPPARDANGQRTCSSDNLSTYCLASKLTKAYIQYRANLISRRGNLSDALQCQRENDSEPAVTVDIAGTIAGQQGTFIDREIESAKISLDVALAAYSEFQTAYPMHKKYEEIIAELEKYRDEFSRIRKNIEAYPVKFVNVSTPNCT